MVIKKGKPVVLLHGWGQNIEMMNPIGKGLEKDYRIIILDLPGFGKSSEPTYGYTIYDYDKYICRYAIENDIPLLGICLGMQIMANSIELNKVNHNNITHKINTIGTSIISKIVGNCYVNSRHNFHVTDIGNYKVSAYSEDGIIEAIEYPSKKFNVGVQWHPEDMIDFDVKQFNLFKEFIKATK